MSPDTELVELLLPRSSSFLLFGQARAPRELQVQRAIAGASRPLQASGGDREKASQNIRSAAEPPLVSRGPGGPETTVQGGRVGSLKALEHRRLRDTCCVEDGPPFETTPFKDPRQPTTQTFPGRAIILQYI